MTKILIALAFILILAACAPIAPPELPAVENTPELPPIAGLVLGGAGLTPGTYQAYVHTGTAAYLEGGLLEYRWNQIEGTRNSMTWATLDSEVANVASGNKAIIRIMLRCNSGNTEVCTPSWALGGAYQPISVYRTQRLHCQRHQSELSQRQHPERDRGTLRGSRQPLRWQRQSRRHRGGGGLQWRVVAVAVGEHMRQNATAASI